MDKEQIEKLAKLSRLSLKEEEKEGFLKDFKAILGYVSEINSVVAELPEKETGKLRNVMREDGEPHESGINTDDILSNAPSVQDGFVKVKQVFE
ncbi:MAG: Asp-tRNA(Asn)/Glu-tRNA(Gln) amidotransferase subunit GatC [Candidatus Paceibacterota bacterium]|jgi:aspartyl-tRNA(Asn)/glutamyl-tRNA(Gln) amidotransferase subunit C